MNFNKETLIEIEDYINALHEQVGLSISTLADVDNAIGKKRNELEKLPIQNVVKVDRSETTVNCVSCGEPLTSSETLNEGNCCDLCWLSH